jgi:hypothetical protein
MLQSFNFSGASTNIAATGSYFLYAECTTARLGINDRVMLMIDGNTAGIRRPGDWIRLPFDAKRWQLIPVDPACAGVVDIGTGHAGTSRTVGQVEIVDGGVQRSLSGSEYLGVGNISAGAGNVPFVGLIHTTRRVSIRKLNIQLNTIAGRIQLRQFTGTPAGATVVTCRSKEVGNVLAGFATHNWQEVSEASALVTPGYGLGVRIVDAMAGGRLAEYLFDPPLVVGLNEGVMLSMNSQASLFCSFEGTVL